MRLKIIKIFKEVLVNPFINILRIKKFYLNGIILAYFFTLFKILYENHIIKNLENILKIFGRFYLKNREIGNFYINPLDFDVRYNMLVLTNTYELISTGLMKRILRKGDIAVDIGANVGYYTLIMAKLVGEEGKVYAFEPATDNFEILLRNIWRNKLKNVIPIKKAVANFSGKVNLYMGGGSVDYRITKTNKFVEIVEAIKLDDLNLRVDFIKIDVQGAEMFVLEGAEKTIRKSKPILLLEFWPAGLKGNGFDPFDLIERLYQLGYTKLFIINDANLEVHPFSTKVIKLIIEKDGYVNILALN